MALNTTRRGFITSTVAGAAALAGPIQVSNAKPGRALDLEVQPATIERRRDPRRALAD